MKLNDIFKKHRYYICESMDKGPFAEKKHIEQCSKELMSRKLADIICKHTDIEWDDFMNEIIARLELYVFTRKELGDLMRSIESEVIKKHAFMNPSGKGAV